MTCTEIAKALKVSRKAVHRWITRVQQNQPICERQHTGRKRLLSTATCRKAYMLLTKTGCDSASRVAIKLYHAGFSHKVASRTTIIKAARAYAKETKLARPVTVHARPKKRLSDAHKQARLSFATSKLNMDWSKTLFTDRVKFVLDKPGVKFHPKIWKPSGSEWSTFIASKPGIYYNVYGGVCLHGTTCLIPVTGTTCYHGKRIYKTKQGKEAKGITQSEYKGVLWILLQEGTRLFHGSRWQLMQDGDKAHRVAQDVIRQWNRRKPCKVVLLKGWPANSPDLNIIENVWSIVKSKVQARGCTTNRQFKGVVNKEFESLPQAMIKNLFASIPKRLKECIERGGSRTRH